MDSQARHACPEYRAMRDIIRKDIAELVLRMTLMGIVSKGLKPVDGSEILVDEGINLIAGALLATGQSPDFDQLAAEGVRVQLFDKMRRMRDERS